MTGPSSLAALGGRHVLKGSEARIHGRRIADKPVVRPPDGYDKTTTARDVHDLLGGRSVVPIWLVDHDIGAAVASAYAARGPDEVSHLAMIERPLPGFGLESAAAPRRTRRCSDPGPKVVPRPAAMGWWRRRSFAGTPDRHPIPARRPVFDARRNDT